MEIKAREFLALRTIVEAMLELMNERARREGHHRPEDDAREKDLADRLLALHEKILAGLGDHCLQMRAETAFIRTPTVGNA